MRTIGEPSRGPCSTTCRSPSGSLKIRPSGSVIAAFLVSPSVMRALMTSSASSAATTPMPIFSRLPMAVVTLAGTMEKFVIQGGVPHSGELTVAGNKNAALPILAACLLTEEEVLLHRVPRIRDTEAQIALLERLGVEVAWVADNSVRLCARGVTSTTVDEELSSKIRASFLLAGPLLARFGEARMPPPGGDFIGRRRLDAHLDAFKDLGARVDGNRGIELAAPGGLCACEIFMDEP